jgi:hypothetical protein
LLQKTFLLCRNIFPSLVGFNLDKDNQNLICRLILIQKTCCTGLNY